MEHTNLTARELSILLAIIRCGDGAYGPAINEELRRRTGENLSPGALYSVLDRLERKKLVDSRMGDATPERGGRRKRYLRVNGAGLIALAHATCSIDQLREGVRLPELSNDEVAV